MYLVERAGYWECIEDGDSWTVKDENDQPISTIPDILNELAEDGWRSMQLLETTHQLGDVLSVGKQYMVLLEKAL